jgi:hypothetical protein
MSVSQLGKVAVVAGACAVITLGRLTWRMADWILSGRPARNLVRKQPELLAC